MKIIIRTIEGKFIATAYFGTIPAMGSLILHEKRKYKVAMHVYAGELSTDTALVIVEPYPSTIYDPAILANMHNDDEL